MSMRKLKYKQNNLHTGHSKKKVSPIAARNVAPNDKPQFLPATHRIVAHVKFRTFAKYKLY